MAPAVLERSSAANGPARGAHTTRSDASAALRPSFVRASRGGDGPDVGEDREDDEGRDDNDRRTRRRSGERDEDGRREVVRRSGAASVDRDEVDEPAGEAEPGEPRDGADGTVAPAPAAAVAPTPAPGPAVPAVPQPAVVPSEPDEPAEPQSG